MRTSWQIIKLTFLMWKIAVTCSVVLPSLQFGTENGLGGEGRAFIFCTPRLGRKSWQRNLQIKTTFSLFPKGYQSRHFLPLTPHQPC